MNQLRFPDPVASPARIGLALVIGALLAFAAAGCGAGGSSSSDAGGGTAGSATRESGESSSQPGNASAEFLTPGGDNSIQTYGREADDPERREASAVLAAFMAARADQDWETACLQLSAEGFEPLERLTAPGSGCVGTLAEVSKRLGSAAWANSMTGPIAALRREGEHAFALYHGSGGSDYFIQMTNQGGEWKVAALEPTAFP